MTDYGLKTIYDRNGAPLTDIRARCTRSSLLNDYGQATFEIGYDDPKYRLEYLEYGNYILIRHRNLPPWLGMIDTPRSRKRGYVQVTAYEVNLLLEYRFAPLNTVIEGTPGSKAVELLRLANAQEGTIIRPGAIFSGGVSTDQKANDSVLSHLRSLAKENGHDWTITPKEDVTGKVYAELNWLEKAGESTQLVLAQGINLTYGEVALEETGELINHVEAVVDVDASTEIGTQSQFYFEDTSYGKRAVREVLNGSIDSAGLLTMAEQKVKANKKPQLSTPLGVADVNGEFSEIRLGNVATYKFPKVEFPDEMNLGVRSLRIIGYRFDERTNICELTVGEP
ncbi:MAG: hypothetical protein HYZ24_10835 [Chloroflexi bacterium]|nr:hypothetical protein [Chloroflexota bacterium]